MACPEELVGDCCVEEEQYQAGLVDALSFSSSFIEVSFAGFRFPPM